MHLRAVFSLDEFYGFERKFCPRVSELHFEKGGVNPALWAAGITVWLLVPSDSSDIKLQVKTGTVEDDFKVHNPIKIKGWTRLDFAAKNCSAVVFFSWSFYKQEESESVIKTRLPGSDLNIAAELEGV